MTKFDDQENGSFETVKTIAILTIGGVLLVFLIGILAGFTVSAFEDGIFEAKIVAIIGGLVAVIGLVGFGCWKVWKRYLLIGSTASGPGEARTHERHRRQIKYFAVALVLGCMIGAITSIFDTGDGSLFSGDWEDLSLPPAAAIAAVIVIIGGLFALPIYGFRQIDDYQREQNYIAFTGGMLAVLVGFPVWAVLYAGGFTPPPHAFGIFAIGFVSMFVAYGIAWIRG